MSDKPKDKQENNQSANQRANDAAREAGLTKDEKRQMHDDPRMKDRLSYQELLEIAKDQKKKE